MPFSFHDKYVIVPADKASNNIVFVCKAHYINCLIKELGIDSNNSGNPTYKRTTFDKDYRRTDNFKVQNQVLLKTV